MTVVYKSEAWKHLRESAGVFTLQAMEDDSSMDVAHALCDNGVDHSTRMHISRKANGYLFHCHNCSLSGFYRDREVYTRLAPLTTEKEALVDSKFIYTHERQNRDEWPSHVRLWLAQYEMLDEYSVAFEYDKAMDSLGIPITVYGNLEGWQWRNFKAGKSKYTTSRNKSNKVAVRIAGIGHEFVLPRKTIYIVEDLLSMYKLAASGRNAMALMGTSASDLTNYISAFDNVTIWLDDDTAGHMGAVKLVRELDGLTKGKLITIINRQPKEISMELLKEYPQ